MKSALRRASIAVRPYDPSRDLAELRALNVEHQNFSRSPEPSWPEGKAVVDDYVAYLERECAARDGCVLMAEAEGTILGFVCVVTATRGDSPDDPATFAWIHDIFVRPEHRRQGVATALMAADVAGTGIHVNAVSPVAATRVLRRAVAPGELVPEHVAPAVLFLASSRCGVSGLVIRAAGGRFSLARWEQGGEVDLGAAATPEAVAGACDAQGSGAGRSDLPIR